MSISDGNSCNTEIHMADVMPFPWTTREFYIVDGGGLPVRFTAVTTTSGSHASADGADVVFLKHLKDHEQLLVDVELHDLISLERVFRIMRA